MKPPAFKVLVLADLAPGRPSEPPRRVTRDGVDALLGELRPSLSVKPLDRPLVFRVLSDFEPAALRAAAPELADAARCTAVLHDPAFQALEAAWRGLARVAGFLPAEGAELWVLPTPFSEVRQRFYREVFLPEYEERTQTPLGLVLADFDFDHRPGSLGILSDLARMGEAIQAPVAAQTGAALFGARHLLHLPALADPIGRMQGAEHAAFRALRASETGRWACLLLNRFLLRAPHVLSDYTEPASAAQPESYLWGRGIWLLGASVLRSMADHGHPAAVSGLGSGGQHAGLPVRELPLSRKEKVKTPLEAVFPLPMTEALPYLGLSPLVQLPPELGGQQQPDLVYLHLAANLLHVPDESGAKPGLLTTDATLAYSMLLGWAVHAALRNRGSLAGAPDVAARLAEALPPALRGEVAVSPAEGALHVRLVPSLTVHGRGIEIEFDLPV